MEQAMRIGLCIYEWNGSIKARRGLTISFRECEGVNIFISFFFPLPMAIRDSCVYSYTNGSW